MTEKHVRMIDLVHAVQRGDETNVTVWVDNDAVYAYGDPDDTARYDGDDPRDVLIELLTDLGVKARKP